MTRFKWKGLLVLLGHDPGVGVGDADGQLVGTLNQSFPLLSGDTVSDLGAELLVLHHEDLKFLHVVNQNLSES